MKRIDINPNQINFICAWNLENNNLCSEIIDFFETCDFGETITGNLKFNFLNLLNILILFKGDLIKPKLMCKFKDFFSILFKYFSSPRTL